MMKQTSALRRAYAALGSGIAALVAACSAPQVQQGSIAPPSSAAAGQPASRLPVIPPDSRTSAARTPLDYRRDAAAHLYNLNRDRIYAGRLPPMLYAVGVLEVDLDARGEVRRLHWLRAPSHAPEVMADIERRVRTAAPFPVPTRLGRVTYTDTWLWHESGRFQLHTLTEGQD